MNANGLTLEEQATNAETSKHIRLVGKILHLMVKHLLDRADGHDLSKLDRPEVELFTKFTAQLAGLTYGSAEFNACKAAMGPALDHHYANNSHHPARKQAKEPWAVTDADIAALEAAVGREKAWQVIWWAARCHYMTKVADAFQLPLETDNPFRAMPGAKKDAK